MPKAEIDRAVQHAAKILHIEHLLDRKPKDLSGGQRQRVAIGRAIVRKPEVFLFDEPLSNLDAALRVRMRYEFAKLHKDLKTTMIYVTHDQVEAMTLADRIVVLSPAASSRSARRWSSTNTRTTCSWRASSARRRHELHCRRVCRANASAVATVRLNDGALIRCAVSAATRQAGRQGHAGHAPRAHSPIGRAPTVLRTHVTFVESPGQHHLCLLRFPGWKSADL
jgi:multiple sugar transport system ATP-binding protein